MRKSLVVLSLLLIVFSGYSKKRKARAKKETYLNKMVKNIYSDHRVYSPYGNILVSSFNIQSVENKNLGYVVSVLDTTKNIPSVNAVVMPLSSGLSSNFVFENRDVNYSSAYLKDIDNSGYGFTSYSQLSTEIKTQITATKNVSVFSFTFPKSKESKIQVDLSSLISAEKLVSVEFDELNGVYGWCELKEDSVVVKKYFFAEFSRYYESWGVWEKFLKVEKKELKCQKNYYEDTLNFQGVNTGFYINYTTSGNDHITMKIAFSNESGDHAKSLIDEETPDWDFYEIADAVENQWETYFESFSIAGLDKFTRGFFDALYDSMIFTLSRRSFIYQKQSKDIDITNHTQKVMMNILSNSESLVRLFDFAGLKPVDSSFESFEIGKPKLNELDFKLNKVDFVLQTNIDSLTKITNDSHQLDMIDVTYNNKTLPSKFISLDDIYNGGILNLKFEIK